MAEYGIETEVNEPHEMLGKVDAVMVTARDGKYHAEFARPFIEAGIPVFIDKPFAVSIEDALDLVRLAKSNGVPICGGSMLKYAYDAHILKGTVLRAGDTLRGGTVSAPLHIEAPYSGFYFYSPHCAEITLTIFGYNPISATAKRNGDSVTAIVDYGEFSVTNHFIGGYHRYTAQVFANGMSFYREIDLSMCAKLECEDFVNMLSSGKMSHTYEELAAPVFYLNAVKESYETGKTVSIGKANI